MQTEAVAAYYKVLLPYLENPSTITHKIPQWRYPASGSRYITVTSRIWIYTHRTSTFSCSWRGKLRIKINKIPNNNGNKRLNKKTTKRIHLRFKGKLVITRQCLQTFDSELAISSVILRGTCSTSVYFHWSESGCIKYSAVSQCSLHKLAVPCRQAAEVVWYCCVHEAKNEEEKVRCHTV
jgi:hypothetical protein